MEGDFHNGEPKRRKEESQSNGEIRYRQESDANNFKKETKESSARGSLQEVKVSAKHKPKVLSEAKNFLSSCKARTDDQAKKSVGRMPRHQEPKKDVISCEKLR